MREPDCILVRTGEQALKSKQVQRRWWKILLNNIRAALQAHNIEFRFETNPNRIFVYTKELEKTEAALGRTFGITSFSRAWACSPALDEMKELAVDVAKNVLKLDNTQSFAIRAYRSGKHEFTSRTIAEEAGAAVKEATGAGVDLRNPDKEIEIEARPGKAYIFIERMKGPGGLPVGTAGTVIAVVKDKDSAIAAWLISKRGAQLVLFAGKKARKYAEALKKWHYGRKLEMFEGGKLSGPVKAREIKAVVTGEKLEKSLEKGIKALKLLHLRPLVAMNAREKNRIAREMGI